MPLDSERRSTLLKTDAPDELIGEASRLLAVVNAQRIPGGNSPERAEAKRILNYTADLLMRASCEVRMLHHSLNGFSDPLG